MQLFTFEDLYENESVGEVLLDLVIAALRMTQTVQAADIANILEVRKRDLGGAVLMLTGMTLDKLIHRWRVRQAQTLLAEGRLTEQEIAHRCGWQSVRVMRRHLARANGTE